MADPHVLETRACQMRREPVLYERRLWKLLRDRRLKGLKFRRQVPLGAYVADFVCFRHRLIVEADGPAHENSAYDERRDAWLRGEGFRVLRFKNQDIENRCEHVLGAILSAVAAPPAERPARPLIRPGSAGPPSPARGEGR